MTLAGQPPTKSFETILAGAVPRRPARLATAVLSTMVDKIVGGELLPESSLPTESALCEVFGVSRTVIREALKLLEDLKDCHDGSCCPHGRRSMLALSRDELARRFQRPGAVPL